jgi:hypothetical protein
MASLVASGAGDRAVQMIDSTMIPLPGSACRHAREGGRRHGPRGPKRVIHLNALSLFRGGVSTKIHAPPDANGVPLALPLTPGQTADTAAAPELLAPGQTRPRELLADKGCGRRRPARGAMLARRAPHHPVEVEPQSAWHAGPAPLCSAQLHRAHVGFAEAVSPRRDALRQNRRKLPQLCSTRRNPEVDALCPHGLASVPSCRKRKIRTPEAGPGESNVSWGFRRADPCGGTILAAAQEWTGEGSVRLITGKVRNAGGGAAASLSRSIAGPARGGKFPLPQFQELTNRRAAVKGAVVLAPIRSRMALRIKAPP